MSKRYERRFEQLRKTGNKAFIPFTLLGWPSPDESLKIIRQMIESGVSALELGIAFSDPVADGPVIQKAAYETLSSGFSVADAFALLGRVRKLDQEIPIGILVYFNTVLAQGIDKFFSLAKGAGIDGVLIADLPAESADEVMPSARNHGIDIIFLVSPVTTPARLHTIVQHAGGFLYLVSRLGVTGTMERSAEQDSALGKLIEQLRQKTKVPICAGFGISSAADAEKMFDIGVDGVISGSRVVQYLQSGDSNSCSMLQNYYRDMLSACQGRAVSKQPSRG